MAFSKCSKTFDYWDAAADGNVDKVKLHAIDYQRQRDTRPSGHGNTALIISVLYNHPDVFHLLYPIEHDIPTEDEVEYEGHTFAAGTPPFVFAICSKTKQFQDELEQFCSMPGLLNYIINYESPNKETALHFVASSGNCLFLAESSPDRLITGETPPILKAADNGLTTLFYYLLNFVQRGYRSLTEKRNLQKIKDFVVKNEADIKTRLKAYKACREVFEELVKQSKIKDEF